MYCSPYLVKIVSDGTNDPTIDPNHDLSVYPIIDPTGYPTIDSTESSIIDTSFTTVPPANTTDQMDVLTNESSELPSKGHNHDFQGNNTMYVKKTIADDMGTNVT